MDIYEEIKQLAYEAYTSSLIGDVESEAAQKVELAAMMKTAAAGEPAGSVFRAAYAVSEGVDAADAAFEARTNA